MKFVDGSVQTQWTLEIGGLTRDALAARLEAEGVGLNPHARTLLADPVFDDTARRSITVVERAVADLGLIEGAPLAAVFARAEERGLALCPAITAPYLRLALPDQASAPDSILSTGRAPTGSLQVASPRAARRSRLPEGVLPARHRRAVVAARLPVR